MNRMTVFYDHIRNAVIQEQLEEQVIFSRLTSAGISGTEIEYQELIGEEGAALAKKLATGNLPISSVYCTFYWEDPDKTVDYNEVLNRLEQLDIHNLLAIPGYLKPGQTKEEAHEYYLPFLKQLCKVAGTHGIQVLMEDFDAANSPCGTASDLKWFFDRIPELGCAFDTGNFLYHAEDSFEVLPLFESRIKYVHCKDRSLTAKPSETPTTSIDGKDMYSSPVGGGVIKMTEIVQSILDSGYAGTFAIEHFGSMNQFNDMLASASYLKNILGETINIPKLYALSGKDDL